MAESVGVSFVDENDFQEIANNLNNKSQFEVWSTVSSDNNGSQLAGISDFSKDIVSEAGSDSCR